MSSPAESASPDELGIFIDDDGNYRILVPRAWSIEDRRMPEFAYLVTAAVVRLSRRSEVEFARGLAEWAETDLQRDRELDLPRNRKPRRGH